ncbi:MAG: beta-N-acetylhexosaminidase [Microbacteriaceae bacterium]
MSGGREQDALGVLLPGFVGVELPSWLERRLREGLAGVCLFGENIVDPEQVRALTDAIRAANPAAIIAIDEEGGDVTRLHHATGSPYPGNAVLGRLDDLHATAAVAGAVARELAAAGVNLNFAPDVDVNSNPDNPVIGVRSFSDDPRRAALHAAAWVSAHEAAGVAVSAKHFPGHGDTALDSHVALPVIDVSREVLIERELAPFRAAIAAGARTVMSSHILVPQLDATEPATFSATILESMLRAELGFTGVIVTDALDMAGASGEIGIPAAAVKAIAAGCDLLCIGTRNTDEQIDQLVAALDRAVDDGGVPASRLGEAAGRVRELAAGLEATVPAGRPQPSGDDAPDLIALAALRDTFDASATPAPGATVVTVETAANIAVGAAPWGLAAAGASVIRLTESDALPGGDGPLVIVGKANHRHPWVRDLIDRARLTHPGSVAIDMGWPSPDRAYADIATFGGSRLIGRALRAELEEAGVSAS